MSEDGSTTPLFSCPQPQDGAKPYLPTCVRDGELDANPLSSSFHIDERATEQPTFGC